MKEFKITEEQIKELAKGNSKVKKWFPEVFETKMEVGKWYKRPKYGSSIFCITKLTNDYVYAYGLTFKNKWTKNCEFCDNSELDSFVLATEEEVFEALEKEAIKIGFKEGVFISNNYAKFCKINTCYNTRGFYIKDNIFYLNGYVLLEEDIWAEIIPTLTKEEAEKQLNAKIID